MGYASQFGALIRFSDGTEERFEGYRISYLRTVAIGKMPFELARGSWTLWPAVGLQLDYNLQYEYNGTKGGDVNDEPHDATAVAGVGADVRLGSATLLTVSLLAGYNLTPSLGPAVSEDTSGIRARGVQTARSPTRHAVSLQASQSSNHAPRLSTKSEKMSGVRE